MATTDAKPGFRLPWSGDRNESDAGPATLEDRAPGSSAEPSTPDQENETDAMIDAVPATTANEAAVDAEGVAPEPEPQVPAAAPASAAPAPAVSSGRKPNKFMADLTRAMQAAAESARTDTLERLAAEAKTHIESIHAASSDEATELRKRADDDVAAVREWSKAEIARIREETDERIAHRKSRLEREIDEHAAAIEARIERVQRRVAAFESDMAEFFERLLAEQDPTRFAAMAESLPEPPPFGDEDDSSFVANAAAEPVEADQAPVAAEAVMATDESAAETPMSDGEATAPAETEGFSEEAAVLEAAETVEPVATVDDGQDAFGVDAEATIESAETADPAADDPRLSILGMTTDFAAAEAEAASFQVEDEATEPVPEIADEAIAARLAGLVPETEASTQSTGTTRLVVLGLVSVASIAGFKRHLSRANGVQSVGVSSGPDGEFVFTVSHDTSVAMRDVVPTLPGFAARVTGEADGELTVTAQDPETEN